LWLLFSFGLVVVEESWCTVFLGANSCYYAGGDKAAPTVGHIASLQRRGNGGTQCS